VHAIAESPGVYVVCRVKEGNLGVDRAGILYVGSTTNLARRLKSLLKAIHIAKGVKTPFKKPRKKYGHTLALTGVEFHLAWKVDREGYWRPWYSVDGRDYDITH
jgi:hypothetical protein